MRHQKIVRRGTHRCVIINDGCNRRCRQSVSFGRGFKALAVVMAAQRENRPCITRVTLYSGLYALWLGTKSSERFGPSQQVGEPLRTHLLHAVPSIELLTNF